MPIYYEATRRAPSIISTPRRPARHRGLRRRRSHRGRSSRRIPAARSISTSNTGSHRLAGDLEGERGPGRSPPLSPGLRLHGVQKHRPSARTAARSATSAPVPPRRGSHAEAFGPRVTFATGFDGLPSYDTADFLRRCPCRATAAASASPTRSRRCSRGGSTTLAPLGLRRRGAAGRRCRRCASVPGLRFDHYYVVEHHDKFDVDPRFSARWAVTPRLALKGTSRHLPPAPDARSSSSKEFGNLNLALLWADR